MALPAVSRWVAVLVVLVVLPGFGGGARAVQQIEATLQVTVSLDLSHGSAVVAANGEAVLLRDTSNAAFGALGLVHPLLNDVSVYTAVAEI